MSPRARSLRRALDLLLATLAFLPAGAAHGQTLEVEPALLALRSASRLWIEGQSNVLPWSCNAHLIRMEVMLSEPPRAEPRVREGTLTIPVLGLECGNDRMTENLRVALAAASHPDIRFEVTSVDLVSVGPPSDEMEALARGNLTAAGITRPFEVRVRGVAARDGDLVVRGSASLRMTDFGVRPPIAFAGLIKAKDEVAIGFDLVLAHTNLERYRRGEL